MPRSATLRPPARLGPRRRLGLRALDASATRSTRTMLVLGDVAQLTVAQSCAFSAEPVAIGIDWSDIIAAALLTQRGSLALAALEADR